MITTNEAIKDPLAFLHADPSIIIGHELLGRVISGPDLDVLVDPTSMLHELDKPASWPACDFLGDLYLRGTAYTQLPDGERYMLRWFPSSRAMNDLSEEIGRKPGEDALKFETVPHGEVQNAPYMRYLASGIFPQSGRISMFDHDRDSNHAPGNFLLPPRVVRTIIERACSRDERLVGKFDNMSASYGDMIRYCATWENWKTKETEQLLIGNFTSDLKDIDGFRTFWTQQNSPQKARRFMADIGQRLVDHLDGIRPRLHEIQAARRQRQAQ